MKCPQCRLENPAGTTVCTSCGSPLFTAADSASEEAARAQRRKRAFSSGVDISGSSPYITQPSAGRQRVSQVERQMSVLLGGLFVIVMAVSALAIYLNVPKEGEPYYGSPFAAMIEHALRKPVRNASAETWTGKEIGAAMLYDVNAQFRDIDAMLAEAPSAAGQRTYVESATESMEPEQPRPRREKRAKKTEPIQEAAPEVLPPLETPTVEAQPVQVAAVAPVEATAPPPRKEPPATNQVAVVDRSITSEKPRKRLKSGCMAEEGESACGHRYVVEFKRTWGPVLEERVYPSREMSQRAQALWHREGKILEPNGKINETYVVKPKTFSPIPGHSV